MSILNRLPSSEKESAIRERILNLVPAASLHMEKILTLLDIQLTEEINSAAVECVSAPRLLLNEGFIDTFCRSDADLGLLIFHELYHIILGHTELFDLSSDADNVAFDAIINSLLARTVGASLGVNLFVATNRFDTFPERLLRPPPSWPECFSAEIADLPENEQRVINLLYGKDSSNVTYHDVFQLLRKTIQEHDGSKGTTPPFLLGNHSRRPLPEWIASGIANACTQICKAARRENDPEELGPMVQSISQHRRAPAGTRFKRAVREVFRTCMTNPSTRGRWAPVSEFDGQGPLLNARDRRITAVRALTGTAPLLYRNPVPIRQRKRFSNSCAHLYLDVSPSMHSTFPFLADVCSKPFEQGELRVFAFSTVVSELTGTTFKESRFDVTSGTDVGCVVKHLIELPAKERPRCAVLVTDGHFRAPPQSLTESLQQMRIIAALTTKNRAGVAAWVSRITFLPSVRE
jgi:hypothetical protein